jgi:hypothetical protein
VPVRVANRDAVLAALRAAGFDATARSSLVVIPPVKDAISEQATLAPWLSETIFVPGGEDMPDQQWERLVAILVEVAFPVPARLQRRSPELCDVAASL